MKKNNKILINTFVAITYLAMITINALANILPINNMTTGDISDKYGNLFAPAGITFSIWGLIYLLLAAYVVYQFGLFQGRYECLDTIKNIKVKQEQVSNIVGNEPNELYKIQ